MLNRRLFLSGAFATAATSSAGLNSRPLWAAESAAPRALVDMLGGFFTHLFDSIIPAARANGVADPLQTLRRIYIDTGPYSVRNAGWFPC